MKPVIASRFQNEKLELKMTAMIDVVFLLLAFFLVLPIPRKEVVIETLMPRGRETGQNETQLELEKEFEDIAIFIRIDELGTVRKFVNDQRMLTPGEMLSRLRAFQKMNEDARVIITCDDDVPYQDFFEVISVADLAHLKVAFADVMGAR